MITVQLEQDGPITLMDEATLIKTEGSLDNAHEFTTWTEYRLPGVDRPVHRSVHITLKEGIGVEAVLGQLG